MSRALSRADDCSACGIAVKLHYDDRNRMIGCEGAAAKHLPPVDRGRLFRLKLKKNYEARQATLCSIREVFERGVIAGYAARVGGAVRGKVVRAVKRETVERIVNEHYNSEMLAFIEREGQRRLHG